MLILPGSSWKGSWCLLGPRWAQVLTHLRGVPSRAALAHPRHHLRPVASARTRAAPAGVPAQCRTIQGRDRSAAVPRVSVSHAASSRTVSRPPRQPAGSRQSFLPSRCRILRTPSPRPRPIPGAMQLQHPRPPRQHPAPHARRGRCRLQFARARRSSLPPPPPAPGSEVFWGSRILRRL